MKFQQDRQCAYNVILRRVRATFDAEEKRVTYSECVFVAFGTQPAISVRHSVICCLSGSTVVFPYYLINDTIMEHKMCVAIFSTTFV